MRCRATDSTSELRERVRDRLADTQTDRDRLAALLEKALEPRPGLLERIAKLVRD